MQLLFKLVSTIGGLFGYASTHLPTLCQDFATHGKGVYTPQYYPLDDEHFPEVDRSLFIVLDGKIKLAPVPQFENCLLSDPRVINFMAPQFTVKSTYGQPRPPQVVSPPPPAALPVPGVPSERDANRYPDRNIRRHSTAPRALSPSPASYGPNVGYTFAPPALTTNRPATRAEVHAAIVGRRSSSAKEVKHEIRRAR